MRKFLILFVGILAGLLFLLLLPWLVISVSTYNDVYTDSDTIPARTYGLLLGTTPSIKGKKNLFFTTRIEAAKRLFDAGKIKKIIVSGDNNTPEYNEPEYMKQSLIERGIPSDAIIQDFAGFRTLDSMLRSRSAFGISGTDIIVISQPFHIERAIFLAKSQGIHTIGFGAADISLKRGWITYIREIAARWMAMYDVIAKTPAKFPE